MDFNYSPQEEAFRQELRTWLEANLPRDYDPDTFEQKDADERFRLQVAWQEKLFAGRWVGIHWPCEYGGRGATVLEQAVYQEELTRVRAPNIANILGVMLVGPTLIHWGTEEQKQRYVANILSAKEIWCQGFSEPGAGSDLASLQTRAVEDGDFFVVNGQKVWTSYAHWSDWCLLLARTNPTGPKHQGLTCLLVNMKSPGVTVRPLVQITGDADFNEVFFEDVRVPKTNLVGQVNQGWQVAVTTLMFERTNFGMVGDDLEPLVRQLAGLSKHMLVNDKPASTDHAVRQRIAQFMIEAEAAKYNRYRQLTRQLHGDPPGPEGSVAKLASTDLHQRIAHFALELLGPYSQLTAESSQSGGGDWSQRALFARMLTLAGGTSEIQRNIIGERVLGLPKG